MPWISALTANNLPGTISVYEASSGPNLGRKAWLPLRRSWFSQPSNRDTPSSPLLSPNQLMLPVLLCLVHKAMCTCSDELLSCLSAVLDCVTALLALERKRAAGGQWSHSSMILLSLLSFDFQLFYCAAMALLCVLYCLTCWPRRATGRTC